MMKSHRRMKSSLKKVPKISRTYLNLHEQVSWLLVDAKTRSTHLMFTFKFQMTSQQSAMHFITFDSMHFTSLDGCCWSVLVLGWNYVQQKLNCKTIGINGSILVFFINRIQYLFRINVISFQASESTPITTVHCVGVSNIDTATNNKFRIFIILSSSLSSSSSVFLFIFVFCFALMYKVKPFWHSFSSCSLFSKDSLIWCW